MSSGIVRMSSRLLPLTALALPPQQPRAQRHARCEALSDAVNEAAAPWEDKLQWCRSNLEVAVRDVHVWQTQKAGRLIGLTMGAMGAVGATTARMALKSSATSDAESSRQMLFGCASGVFGFWGLYKICIQHYPMDPTVRRAEQEHLFARFPESDKGFAALRAREGDDALKDALRRGILCVPFLRACVGADLCSVGLGKSNHVLYLGSFLGGHADAGARTLWAYLRRHGRFLVKCSVFSAPDFEVAMMTAKGSDDLTWDDLFALTPQRDPDAIDLLSDGIFPAQLLRRCWCNEASAEGQTLRQLDLEVRGRWSLLFDRHVIKPGDLQQPFMRTAREEASDILAFLEWCKPWLLADHFGAVVPQHWQHEIQDIMKSLQDAENKLAKAKKTNTALSKKVDAMHAAMVAEAKRAYDVAKDMAHGQRREAEQRAREEAAAAAVGSIQPSRSVECALCLEPLKKTDRDGKPYTFEQVKRWYTKYSEQEIQEHWEKLMVATDWQCRYCGNASHRSCAEKWLSRNATCPYCRASNPTAEATVKVPQAVQREIAAQESQALKKAKREFKDACQRADLQRQVEAGGLQQQLELSEQALAMRRAELNLRWKVFAG
eukprot:TRINITY_DN29366_c0_g1_i1.p1 TRINITY_DN29366_c0_g1~~TRINITY_DN29366_c0_g1_i1.p1  ORF type:complete len:605 (-),score=109.35 TRINITY_DN29366_c0_g1_i1:74-1888(-)